MTWLDEIKDGPLYWEHAVPNDEEPFRALSQERVEWLVAIAEAAQEWKDAGAALELLSDSPDGSAWDAGVERYDVAEDSLRSLLEQQP